MSHSVVLLYSLCESILQKITQPVPITSESLFLNPPTFRAAMQNCADSSIGHVEEDNRWKLL